jgi:hypothetical protein
VLHTETITRKEGSGRTPRKEVKTMNCSYYTSPDDDPMYEPDCDPEFEEIEADDFEEPDEPEEDSGHYDDGVLL